MIYKIYNVAMYLIQPIIWMKLLWRSIREPAYLKRWAERYGYCHGKVLPKGIILHSVSVGETLAAIPLIQVLRQHYPLLPITVTTTTPTGSERVQTILSKYVHHVYFPYDLKNTVNRFLNILQPKLIIIMETEIWPNFIKESYCRNIPILIINARLSHRSVNNYKKVHCFIMNVIRSITLIAVQSNNDKLRFLSLGANKKQLTIIGNLKFDISITPKLHNQILSLHHQWKINRFIWIATSTHQGEEILLLEAHRKLLITFPNLLFIIVPRHPKRFEIVRNIVIKHGFSYILRSSKTIPLDSTQVMIGDTMGELMLLYGIATLAFIGGSLVKHGGGHNPLEAAVHGIPILIGPYTLNFYDIYQKLKISNGLIIVKNISSLVNTIITLLNNKNYRLYYGYNALKVLNQNKGVSQRLLKLIEVYLST